MQLFIKNGGYMQDKNFSAGRFVPTDVIPGSAGIFLY